VVGDGGGSEELLRKLLVTSVAVLLDPGSPVQVSFVVSLWPRDARYLFVAETGDVHPLQIGDWLVQNRTNTLIVGSTST
jgi:hypothetical protein